MIKYNPKTWFIHIFKFYKSDTIRILAPELIIMGLLTAGICYAERNYLEDITKFKSTISIHSLVGIVLGLILVFRTNTAYERWWEGRKLWGQLINCTRNAALKINAIVKDKSDREQLREYLIIYPVVLKDHLRNRVSDDFDDSLFENNELFSHRPNFVASKIYNLLKEMLQQNKITGEEFILIDREIAQLTEITGACERIKNTPIPFSYSLFMKKFIFIYVITLPIGLIPDFGYWASLVTMFIFYVLVSLEILAEEIEDPFGMDDNDLPMDEMSKKIKNGVNEILL